MYYVLILLVKQRVTAITAKPPPQPRRVGTSRASKCHVPPVTTVDTIDGNWYYRSTTQVKMNCSPAIL
jgi:hypothetical protein